MRNLIPAKEINPEAQNTTLSELQKETENLIHLIKRGLGFYAPKPVTSFSKSYRVQLALMAKIANDLKVIAQLAHDGFPIQAGTVASSLSETVWVSLDIRGDNKKAGKWLEHTEGKVSYGGNLTDFRKKTITTVFGHNEQIAQEISEMARKGYEYLCRLKHGNPIYLKQLSYGQHENSEFPIIGSQLSNTAREHSFTCIKSSMQIVLYPLIHFCSDHLQEKPEEVQLLWDDIIELWKRLNLQNLEQNS